MSSTTSCILYRCVHVSWAMSHLDELFADLPANLTVAQTAEILGIRPSTVYKWLNEGVLPGYKVGSAWVILRDEVKDRIRSGRNLPDEAAEPLHEGDGL